MSRVAKPLLVVLAVAGALALGGCPKVETIEEASCPPQGTTLTWSDFGEEFFAAHCNGCHGADLGQRAGAPTTFVFDSRDEVFAHRERIFSTSAGNNDSMPPGPDDPPLAERQKLAEWLACGAP
jgi:uncharacterized membrane protein